MFGRMGSRTTSKVPRLRSHGHYTKQDTQAWLSSLPPPPLLEKEWQVHSSARSQEGSQ